MDVATEKITKRTVAAAEPRASRYIIFDSAVPGFGLRVFPSGEKSWVFDYRPGEGGRAAPKRRVTIGSAASGDPHKLPDYTPEAARKEADRLRAVVRTGGDPQGDKAASRSAATFADLATAFIDQHVIPKRSAVTANFYRDLLKRLVLPALGRKKAKDIKGSDVSRLHHELADHPYQANRALAVIGAIYSWAAGPVGLIPAGTNPARGIERYEEEKRGRVLSAEELERLGAAIRVAETDGIPWRLSPDGKAKHRAKGEAQLTVIGPHAAAALRLLIFTGMRLREVLNLRWDQIDQSQGLIVLAKHKTSRTTGSKGIVLNAPALQVLADLPRMGIYVIAGDTAGQKGEKPRSDLKRPWDAVRRHGGLDDLRIHDLRHNFASFGAGGGLGLPIIGKLLGHSQPATTARYSHFDADPLRRASNSIGSALSAAMGDAPVTDNVVNLHKGRGTA